MKVATYAFFDPTAPADVQQFRKISIESHMLHGQPVILKSKFTERDVESGDTVHCPYDHDEAMEQGRQWDPYCFGTGYLGGFRDGVITFATLVDAPVDKVKLDKQGAIYIEQDPHFVFPWTPEIGNGDLVITGIFSPNVYDVLELGTRYLMDEITPTTLRGHGNYQRPFLTQQTATIEKLPLTHELYQVPIVFDYSDLPGAPDPAPGHDPDDQPIVNPGNDTSDPEDDVDVFFPVEEPG